MKIQFDFIRVAGGLPRFSSPVLQQAYHELNMQPSGLQRR